MRPIVASMAVAGSCLLVASFAGADRTTVAGEPDASVRVATQDRASVPGTGAPLPRYREGGTPYDPGQSLAPYAVSRPPALDDTGGGFIESPPEYGPMRGVIFQYSTGSWPSVVRACVKALTADPNHDEIAYVVVSSQSVVNSATASFIADGVDMSKVVFIIQPTNSVWLRDYGPHFIWQDGTVAIVDSHYYPNRPLDNFVPTRLGDEDFGVPTYDMGLYYSGGNFQPGPNRSGFVTSLINLDNPASGGFDANFIAGLYQTYQGIDTLHVMPQLPFSVDGTGHIDMWMYLVDEDTVIISEFLPGSNQTAIDITNNAVPYMQALGFEVFRPKAWNSGGTHYTYTNAFRVNDRIFVPVYGTALVPGGNGSYNDEDADAMAKWQAAVGHDAQIVPIQCLSIIPAAGAIHCIVMQVPRYAESIPSACVVAPAGGDLWLVGQAETIRWNATDTDNADLATADLFYSIDDGSSWEPIVQGIADTGSFDWTIPSVAGVHARIQVVVHSTDGDVAAAISNPFRLAPGTATVYDFSSGAGVSNFGFGRQTSSWSNNVEGNLGPVDIPLTAANYLALSTSNATGGDSDPNRYISPTVSSGSESTHIFEFAIAESPEQIDEIRVLWEGYADACTQAELYVWNFALENWGDGQGQSGQNRFLDNFAGNRDEDLVGFIRSDIGDYIDADGTMVFLVYAERSGDETFHDYMSVTVKTAASCPGDIDGNGVVDGADLGTLLADWGPCDGCAADLDGNGMVDGADLGAALAAWGGCE
ncbi:MAG: agmatine deiminase family protein [Phycisphaerales bacterium]|nr:agmatine deiminase family protein [Phycisphaerales bacterium]